MERDEGKELWWKPAVEVFGRVSAWVVVPIVVALLVGKYLDERYGTKPWLFLGLTVIAFLISSFGIVLTVGRYMREMAEEEKNKENNGNESK